MKWLREERLPETAENNYIPFTDVYFFFLFFLSLRSEGNVINMHKTVSV